MKWAALVAALAAIPIAGLIVAQPFESDPDSTSEVTRQTGIRQLGQGVEGIARQGLSSPARSQLMLRTAFTSSAQEEGTESDGAEPDEVEWALDAEGACESLSPEDVAELNEEEDALAAFLDERGLAYSRDADGSGVNWVVWDYEDDAVNEAVDEFYAERYPMSEDEVAELNEEQAALAAFLEERGVAFTVETDAYGVEWVEWDYEDDAANAAVDEFYAERYGAGENEIAEAEESEVAVDEAGALAC